MYFAGGQLAVFQGGPSRTGGKAPISDSYGSSEQRGKTANRPRPEGCVENGPAARAGSVTSRAIFGRAGENEIVGKMVRDAASTASPAGTVLPTAHLIATKTHAISGTGHCTRMEGKAISLR